MAKQEKTSAELYREERKKRLAKAAKKNSKKSMSSNSAKIAGRIITAILILAIVAGLGTVVVKQTGIIERSATAFTIGDQKVSQAEYGYYYSTAYSQYSQYAQYGYISLNLNVSPSLQPYDNALGEIEGLPEDKEPTWADFFDYSAKQQIKFIKACVEKASEEKIELTDKQIKEIDHNVSDVKEAADKNHYSLSAFLKANYGKGMNEKLFRSILEQQQLRVAYQNAKIDESAEKITAKDIEKEYNKNTTNYATVTLNYITLKAKTVEGDSEDEKTVDKKSLENCKAIAAELAKAKNADEFEAILKSLSSKYDEAKSASVSVSADEACSNTSGLSSAKGFSDWANSANTAKGSTFVATTDNDVTVFMMINPLHKAPDALTYTSRHILIKFPEEEKDEDKDDEKAEAKDTEDKKEIEIKELDTSKADGVTIDSKVTADEAKNKEAYAKIQNILQEYLNGEHTEEAFAALAEKYTEDTGSAENGGLYEDVELGNFVPPYEQWCTADGRKEGDVGIVEYDNEANYSGYHLIYFVSDKITTWDEVVKDSMAENEANEISEELLEKAAGAENISDKAIASAQKFFDNIIKRNAANASQQQIAY